MKKVYGYIGLFVIVVVLLATIVIAQTNFDVLGEKVGAVAKFEELNLGARFSTLLLGLLLFMVLHSVLKKMDVFGDSMLVSVSVAIIMTILTFIYVPVELVGALSSNIAAVGATVLTVIPFLIALYFTVWVTKSLLLARIIWLIYFLYYVVILAYTWGTSTYQSFNFWDPANLIFWVAFFSTLLLFIFIGPIREKVWEETVKDYEARTNSKMTGAAKSLNAWNNFLKKTGDSP